MSDVMQLDSQSARVRAQPFFFGPRDRRLFGWYHPGRGVLSRSSAIVVCPPLGHEYAWTHRSIRYLADRLAGEGFSVMRFDYRGTGDSCGDPGDPGQLAGWLSSIREAVTATREFSGLDTVGLIGLRLGATLAMFDAATHGDVSSMVLWAPYMSGSEYLRELRILQAMTKQPSSQDATRTETMDYGAQGFLLTADAAAELREVDLLRMGCAVPNVLVVPRDDRPRAHQPLVDYLRKCGATVEETSAPGTTAMLVEPVRSLVPVEVLECITRWLSARYPAAVRDDSIEPLPQLAREPGESGEPGGSGAATLPSHRFDGDGDGDGDGGVVADGDDTAAVTEVPVQFGGYADLSAAVHGNLFGIVTLPRASQASAARPAVVFLNTGADHHIGPNRMYVPMARELAARGFLSFRFDLAGLGDSSPSRGEEHITYPNGAVQDIAEAIALLRTTYGVDRVVLVGLCSGAYFAIRAALADLPVAMCMAINPPLYSDNGHLVEPAKLRNYSDVVLLREAPWARKRWLKPFGGPLGLKDVIAASQIKTSVAVQKVRTGIGLRANSEGGGVGALLESLCDRGIDVFILFAHGERARTDLELQLGWQLHALQGHQNFHFELIDGAGHGFRPVHAQQQLQRMLVEHVLERFGDFANA